MQPTIPVALIVMVVVASSCLAAAALGVEILQPAGADSEPRADNRSTHSAFVTTWRTTTDNEEITIPGTGTYDVVWGDGAFSNDTSGSARHTYAAPGTYTVRITGDLVGIDLGDDPENAQKLQSINQWGDMEWTTMISAFRGASNMEYSATDAPDLSRVPDMDSMFRDATAFNGDISSWNVSQVTHMNNMFHAATAFNGDLSSWDVSRVTSMHSMFRDTTSFNGDISSWNVSQVTQMPNMFHAAAAFNGDISPWDVSRVAYMHSMFRDATSFNGDISPWNVSQVTQMPNMFHAAAAFNGDISPWNVSRVTSMHSMFRDATSFNQDLNDWDVSRVTSMHSMFRDATSFNQDLNDWGVSQVTHMGDMFQDATSFNGNVSPWDVSQVADMGYMFYGASSFNRDLNDWNVSQVINMNSMFRDATSFNGNVSSWNVSQVTHMNSMFDTASSFNQDLNDWDVSKVTGMSGMFRDASSFNRDLNDWGVSQVTHMDGMFQDATFFNGNVSPWDVSQVADMGSMFYGASSFNRDLNDWNVPQVDDMNSMFYGATAFNGNVSSWDVSKVADMNSMFDTASSFNQDLSLWDVSQVADMGFMFYGASSFNQPLNDWDVSSVTNMDGMFSGASDFDQNLGNWYVTINSTSIDRADVPGTVGTISAQNAVLDGHGPVYGIASGADSGHFEIDGSLLIMNSTDADRDSYTVNVNAPGDSVFENGNNWRALTVTLTGSANTPPTVTSIVRSDPAEATTSERTLVFEVTFSEDVTGVDLSDFALSPGSTGAGSIAGLTGSGDTYLVTVSATRDGTYNLGVTQDSGIADAADNPLADTDPTGADHTYTVSTVSADTTAPTVASIVRSNPAEATTSERTLVFAVTFSEDVTGVNQTDFALSPGSAGSGSASGRFAQASTPALAIPDNAPAVSDTITVPRAGTATAVSVAVDITHTYIGDLKVEIVAPDGTAQALHSHTGGSANDIDRTYTPDFGGTGIAGDWTLRVRDDAGADTGTLNSWALTIDHGGAGSPVTGLTGSGDTYLVTVSATRDGTYNLDITQDSGIADAADNPLSSPTPTGADHTYAVSTVSADTTAPTVTSIARSDPADQATSAQTLVFAVTFSEDVTGVDLSDFALSPGSTGSGSTSGRFAQASTPALAIPDNAPAVSDTITVPRAGTATAVSVAVDITHTYIGDLKVELVAPDGTAQALHSHTGGSANDIDRTYTPDFGGTGIAGDWTLRVRDDAGEDTGTLNGWALTIDHGGSGSPVTGLTGSGDTYLVTVSVTRDGTYNLDITQDSGIADAADNPLSSPTPTGADHTYAVSTVSADTTAPTVASIVRSDPAEAITSERTLVFEVTFSEDVTGVNQTDFALSPGSAGTGSVTNLAGSGSQYLVNVSATRDGTYNLDITQDSGIADAADNPLSSPTPTGADHTYAVDTTAPTVASIVRSNPAEATTSERTLVFAVTFSEDVTGVNQTDFALSPGSAGTGSIAGLTGSGSQYLVNVSAARDGTYNLDITQDSGIADAADNPLSSPTPTGADHTYTVDTTAPTVTSIGRSDPADQATSAQTLVFAVTFSEDVTGVDAGDFALSPGSAGAGSIAGLTGSGSQYLVNVSATRDGTYNLDITQDSGIADAADNPLSSPTPTGADHTYTVDTTAPTVTSIARSDPADQATSAQTLVFAVTFSEDVTGVDLSDFALSPGSTGAGSIAGLTGSGDTYLVTVSVTRDGTYNLDITQDSGIADAADNPLSSPTPTGADHTYAVSTVSADTTAPTVTSIARSDPADQATSAQTLVFAVTFSEDVTGVDLSDFALSPGSTGAGSIAGLTGSGDTYLVTVSVTRDGTYNLDITQDSGIADAADNPLSSPTPTGADHTYAVSTVSADTTAPTVTSIVRSDPADQATSAQTLVFAVTFSEDVTGVNQTDFALSPGSAGSGSASGRFAQASTPALAIPDNAPAVSDTITVPRAGTATAVSVAVDITHTYIGDLKVEIVAPDGTAQALHSHTGGSANDIDRTYTPDFGGTGIAGDWTLRVRDDAGADTGTLNSWALTIDHGGAGSPVTGLTGSGDTYLVTVSVTRDGTYNLDITQDSGIADAADNPLSSPTPTGADHTYAVSTVSADTTAPTVTSIVRSDPADQATSAQTLVFAVTFSEDVTGVDAGDFALSPDSTGSGSTSGRFAQASTPALAIPDNAPAVSDTITVPRAGTATAVSVAVDITHTYIGDLKVELVAPDGTVQALHSHTGGSANDIDRTYTPDFGGTGIAGDWTLRVRDDAGEDTGTLNGWALTIDHGGSGSPVTGLTGSGDTYLVTVSVTRDGTYNLDITQDSGIADAADNPLSSPTPTGADHTYAVSTAVV